MLSKTPLKALIRVFLFVAIAGSCLLTAIGYASVNALTKAQAQTKYEKQTKEITSSIGERLQLNVSVLYRARAFVITNRMPSQTEWQTFFDNQDVFYGENSVDAVGFARYMQGKPATIAQTLSQDHKVNVNVNPEGERSEYLLTVVSASATPSGSKSPGLDLLSEPTRSAAIEEARNSGSPTLTAPLTLIPSNKKGVVLFLPVYVESGELYGFVTAVYFLDSFTQGILDSEENSQVASSITDKASNEAIYSSSQQVKGSSTSRTDTLKMNNREWTIAYSAPTQSVGDGHYAPYVVLFIGSMLIIGLLSASRIILKTISPSETLKS